MTFPHPRIDGTVDYVHADGSDRGREWFSLHRYPGGRVIRAMCQMNREALIRDASWTVDEGWRPVDGHVRVILGGRIVGSTWFAFDGAVVRCEGRTAAQGDISQVRTSDQPYAFLGLHPLVADGLIAAARGRDRPGSERMIHSITCSYAQNGETGLLALPIDIGVTYVGRESLTVPAGTFDADRYAVRWRAEWPAADYWVFGDDFVFLKSAWTVSGLTCRLATLKFTPADP
jgi:hypothetical protein